MAKVIDHEYTREVVCPHCGYEFRDSWELDRESGDGENIEVECPSEKCGKKFRCWREITIQWSSAPLLAG